MDSQVFSQRVEEVREVMRHEHLAACIFPSSDPHQSKHPADYWKACEWVSGSAGTAVVTMKHTALWTEARYVDTAAWIGEQLREERHPYEDWSEVAIDGSCCTVNTVRQLTTALRREGGITLRTNFDALRHIWKDRPALPACPVERCPQEQDAERTVSKLDRVRKALREKHADGMLMANLDDIAWTLNLRGNDTEGSHVFISYLLLTSQRATLYVNRAKLTPDVVAYLKEEGVAVDSYENVKGGLKGYFEYNILMDPDEVNYALYEVVKREATRSREQGAQRVIQIIEDASPVPALYISSRA